MTKMGICVDCMRIALPAGVLMSRAVLAADEVPVAPPEDILQEVVVTALEPRYVAPTTRDRIGRIWAPVFINDKGPFRLVLDSGATQSGVIAQVAAALGLPLDQSPPVRLRGATGSAVVPTIRVDSVVVGDLVLNSKRLPIITDPLGGAEGILGNEGMLDKRIVIDFRHDSITISRSHGERAAAGFLTIPVEFTHGRLLTVNALVGTVRIKAIIDTGGQTTIANVAMRDALQRYRRKMDPTLDTIIGATTDVEHGEGYPVPPIRIGDLQIHAARVTFNDFQIFKYWGLTDEPAMLVGMDALGLLDTLIIDYRRRELHVKMRD